MLTFGVRTENDRNNVYGRRAGIRAEDGSPVVMIGDADDYGDADPFGPEAGSGKKPK